MNDKFINFAILGAGTAASFHADALCNIENAKLVGVFDPAAKNAAVFSEKYNIKAYKSYEEMLDDESIDAVCICTPSAFHMSQAIAAIEKNKHVALEKPMALNTEDADKIIAACKKNNRLLTVISQLRFSEDIQKAKKLIDDKALGKISLCDLYMKYWRSPEYFSSSSWKGTKKLDGGGALINQGIHGIDIILYLVGNARVLHGKTKTIFHDIDVEDTAVALLEFENGALGVIEASTCAHPGFERKIEINGSKGSVILKENNIEKLVLGDKILIDRTGEASATATASNPKSMSYEMHRKQLSNLISAIRSEEKLFIDAKEGKKSIELIDEIYKFNIPSSDFQRQ